MNVPCENICVVLCEPSHPGNIGAAARAMKTMGLSRLRLVNPNRFPGSEATAMASGADDVLSAAGVFGSLAEAIADAQFVFGTSARLRTICVPFDDPRQAAERITAMPGTQVAIVFGRENSGLTNEELGLCHRLIHVPTVETFGSLNLAQAVQIVAYEYRTSLLAQRDRVGETIETEEPPASNDKLQGFFEHLAQTLLDIRFLHPEKSKSMDQRLRRLFLRAAPSETELNILRGILARVQQRLSE